MTVGAAITYSCIIIDKHRVVPASETVAKNTQGRDKMYDHFGACGVDPRNLAQRIMEVA